MKEGKKEERERGRKYGKKSASTKQDKLCENSEGSKCQKHRNTPPTLYLLHRSHSKVLHLGRHLKI